ncbi:LOW QUALITY PROTEIN: activating molecule in BECN1-regulated autophagy protein 1-like [Acanthaster planci]|uniref:LOW QUALITY PROTEIN: activating molecule in BECN1-regulated autophagy protein 1-like n=1 Tax=Acanthaster planci TaxID=133434 RepID=A0A8B7XTR7_ACAPL|nr:LOW QUALITY PROTEIN: activating molecule in BECN1-regulated autophagy protein 1-like [Acanthaster planci]
MLEGLGAALTMVHQPKNVFLSLKGREIGFRGHIRQNILPHFAEEIAATSSTYNKACNLPGTPRCTFLVTFSHDHKLVASSHGNHNINISRLTTGEHVQTLTGHPRSPWCVTFHPSSNEILASGCLGGEVRVWDLQGSSEVWQSDNHSMIASLSFHPRDQVLAIAAQDQILLWDWRQPVPFASVAISSPLEKVRLVRFSPLGHNLLTGIANAPVDEEEPEYENLDVQHEAYQSSARLSRHGVPEHLNPYPRPPRVEPTLQGTYSTSLPASHDLSASQPMRPVSPIQSETLEDAREYAAAVTLTALGLRRVHPSSSSARDYPYEGSQAGGQNLLNAQSDEYENIYPSRLRRPHIMRNDNGAQNDPSRVARHVRSETGVRSGISSWNLNSGSGDESSGEMRVSDDAVLSSEDGQSMSNRMSDVSIQESRNLSEPLYVNMDVTNGDEIRIARTSLSIPPAQANASRSHSEHHIARLQQLPLNTDERSEDVPTSVSAHNSAMTATSESDQEILAPANEMKPLNLVSEKKHGTLPSTDSTRHKIQLYIIMRQTVTLAALQVLRMRTAIHQKLSDTAQMNSPVQTLRLKGTNQNNTQHSLSNPSTSADRSSRNGQSVHQQLPFSDAQVSSVVQEVELLPRMDGRSSGISANVSSQLVSSASSRDTRPQSSEAQPNIGSTEAVATESCCPSTSSRSHTTTDSESEMQPALQSQILSHPRAAVLHWGTHGVKEQHCAFTAHLGTIPDTAPPDRTSRSDNNTSPPRHNPLQSELEDSASEANLISQSESASSSLSTSSTASVSLPTSSADYANVGALQSGPPQVGTRFGPQKGMRALHFGTVGNPSRSPGTTGSSPNPLDLSLTRASATSHPETRNNNPDMSSDERHLESPRSSIQQAHYRITSEGPSQSGSTNLSQSGSRLDVPNRDSSVRSHHQAEFQPPIPEGIDLSIPNVRQGTRSRAPVAAHIPSSGMRQSSHIATLGAPLPPEPIQEPLQPANTFPSTDAAARYRRYNLWRSPGLHRQRLGGLSQTPDPRDGESLMGENQGDEPRAGVIYGARRVAPLHTRRQLHLALLNQPSRQMTDVERMDMAARVQRRLLRQSRQGPLRAQLGRLSGQFSGHLHHPRNSIFDETYQPPPPMIHATINRAIASAFAGRGETAVANNISNTTYRLQWWDFSEFELPDISDADHNVIVPHCKLHNDASCDISQDGRYLAAFVPSPLGFPEDGVLAIYSLMPHNFGDVLYTRSFGPNAITVNISPLSGFVIVGLASRKLHLHMASKQLIGMIYKLHKEGASEDSLLYVCDVDHSCNDQERRHHVSVNTVKWIPQPGVGLVYGTNRGDLRICSPANFTAPDDSSTDQSYRSDYLSVDDYPRHDLVHRRRSYTYMYQEFGLRNLGLHHPSSSGGGASTPDRRARGTQTPQRALFSSTATQTEEQQQG